MAREQLQADEKSEASLLDRRSYLKLAGTAAAAVATGTNTALAASSSTGYGYGKYAQVPYGGVESSDSVPTIDRFSVSESEQLGDSRMMSVKWAVADADADLDVVEVVVHNGSADVNFSVQDVSGSSASGWELFQFPTGTTLDVDLRVKDAASNAAKDSKTITL